MHRVALSAAALACAAILSAGCSDKPKGPTTVRVAGTLYLDGQPLEGAEVRFFGKDLFVGYATSGPDGKYELVQGAVPGENTVTVQKLEGNVELDPEGGYDLAQLEFERESAQGGPGQGGGDSAGGRRQLIPLQYSDPGKSKLKYTVPEDGTTTADLRITSK